MYVYIFYVYWGNKEKEQIIWSSLSYFRVSNVSSMVSQMSISKCSTAMKDKFKKPDITMDQLKALMQQFIEWVNISLYPVWHCGLYRRYVGQVFIYVTRYVGQVHLYLYMSPGM